MIIRDLTTMSNSTDGKMAFWSKLRGPATLICSFIFTVLLALNTPPGLAWKFVLLYAYCAAFLYGLVAGYLFGPTVKQVWQGSTAAAVLLALPVVFVTYGFALLAAPLVVAFIAIMYWAARLGDRLHRHH
jgi:hypothetical protein